MRIIHTFIWFMLAYKFGDWRNLKKYYPTLLFFGMGDCIYNVVFYNKPLWLYVDPIFKSHLVVGLFNLFTVYFCILIIFLFYSPKRFFKKIPYILVWAIFLDIIEYFFFLTNHYAYFNGWNIIWSLIHYLYMLPLLLLHHSNHFILSWTISFIILMIMCNIFKLPFSEIR
jgi:hypothetical protein